MHHLFAYGTLQLPEVMLAVAGRAFAARPARLDHYSCHRLRGKSFPGIRPNPGCSTAGLLFLRLDAPALRRLDEFEDSFYRREAVTATAADGAEWAAQAYVVREESYGLLLPEEWSLAEFRRKHLERFLLSHE
jgi:gamma-glutamylcyclotransferase (GGCT)/AIG2-like uncharacterized protein YtfP